MTKEIKAALIKGPVKFSFTPNIDFTHYDDMGNVLCGYEKAFNYKVRQGNVKLEKLVRKWLEKDALDENGKPIPLSSNPEDGNLKLVRMGE